MSDSEDELELSRTETSVLNRQQSNGALIAGIILIAVGVVFGIIGFVFVSVRLLAGFGIWGIWFGLISIGSYWLSRRRAARAGTAPIPRPEKSASEDWPSEDF